MYIALLADLLQTLVETVNDLFVSKVFTVELYIIDLPRKKINDIWKQELPRAGHY